MSLNSYFLERSILQVRTQVTEIPDLLVVEQNLPRSLPRLPARLPHLHSRDYFTGLRPEVTQNF